MAENKYVFISMPMRGKSAEQIRGEMSEAYARFVRQTHLVGLTLLDTVSEDAAGDDRSALRLLGQALEKMAGASAVYFTKGWKNSRGCLIEYKAAWKYGLPCYFEDGAEDEDAL